MPGTAVARAVTRVAEKMLELDEVAILRLKESVELDFSDRCALRDVLAIAHAEGRLPYDEAIALHAIAEGWADASIAERIVWMQCAYESAAAR
jgi:hypothetical protein